MGKNTIVADIGLSEVRTLHSKNKVFKTGKFFSTVTLADSWNTPITEGEFLLKYNGQIYKIGDKDARSKALSIADAEKICALAAVTLSADSKKVNNMSLMYLTGNNLVFPRGRQTVFIKKYSHAPVERKEFKLLKTKRVTPVVSSLSIVPNNMDIGYGTVDILTA
jgi:hypothetical protein